MTTVVADTGDLGAVARLKPVDCTTNPTIVLKAVDAPDYRDVVDEALAWGRKQSGDAARVAAATADRLRSLRRRRAVATRARLRVD
jgi:transaldolase